MTSQAKGVSGSSQFLAVGLLTSTGTEVLGQQCLELGAILCSALGATICISPPTLCGKAPHQLVAVSVAVVACDFTREEVSRACPFLLVSQPSQKPSAGPRQPRIWTRLPGRVPRLSRVTGRTHSTPWYLALQL